MYRYWGKARPQTEDGLQWHPLVYHGLDVAAVGVEFLERHHTLRRFLAGSLGLDERTFMAWMAFFLAIHDVGKFSERFQNLRRDLFLILRGRTSEAVYQVRHDSLGFALWTDVLWDHAAGTNWLRLDLARHDVEDWKDAVAPWASAVTGHHGRPPKAAAGAEPIDADDYFEHADIEAAREFAAAAHGLFLAEPGLSPPDRPQDFRRRSLRASWWIAGLSVLADWLGSNADFFPYCEPVLDLRAYWSGTQAKARRALDGTGVHPVPSAADTAPHDLLPQLADLELSPLQLESSARVLADGAQLFVIEDLTGAGKTEAAVIIAHRLMASGDANGAYVALPTMATADAMYARMADTYARLFDPSTRPSLVLAHSSRHLSDRFTRSIVHPPNQPEHIPRDELPATARCTAWLADGSKKALLAHFGVGTIDQAFLAILQSKHQSLRLLGLYRKVLIVDEVHACDAYMLGLLRCLLRFHAASGGSAILMSATLPRRARAALVNSFCDGASLGSPELRSCAYPLLTHVGAGTANEQPVETRPGIARRVTVRWVCDVNAVMDAMVGAAASGRCVCWIRNTVGEAQEAYTRLRERVGEDRLALFHARFAMGDRLATERDVVRRFGKDSGPAERAGRLVVATPVVEQSLDLDFDLLVTDLAPIDLVIQRAGRLCRHRRDAIGARRASPSAADGRGVPVLLIHGPEPVAEPKADWMRSFSPGTASVYEDHAQLWITARELRARGELNMPADARELIESVYGCWQRGLRWEIPADLQRSHESAAGTDAAGKSQAWLNHVQLDGGYVDTAMSWWDEGATPTRLAEPTIAVLLARWTGDSIDPWCEGRFAWDMSQVRVRRSMLQRARRPADHDRLVAYEATLESLPDHGRWTVLLPLTSGGGGRWTAAALNERDEPVQVAYDLTLGLVVSRERGGQR